MSAPEVRQVQSGWWVVVDSKYATVAETREEALRRYETLLPMEKRAVEPVRTAEPA